MWRKAFKPIQNSQTKLICYGKKDEKGALRKKKMEIWKTMLIGTKIRNKDLPEG